MENTSALPLGEATSDRQSGSCDALICFSHLRWSFVFQRPQHLMTRCAAKWPVIFFEEPFEEAPLVAPRLTLTQHGNVTVAVPHLPIGMSDAAKADAQRVLLDQLLAARGIRRPLLWYYAPMSLAYSDHLPAAATVYDCMDELSNFLNPPPRLREMEQRLLRRADVVFTGGYSLYEAKRTQHRNIFCFPSSVDADHFRQARGNLKEPADQKDIPHPRLGFFGVLDERLDAQLVGRLAQQHPEWQIVLIGPVVKVDPAMLPRAPNLHYLGAKTYDQLPSYLAGWDVALMPFAINAATRYISPTKTPEYLAGGKPVVSTPITDVVRHYGEQGLVAIARDAKDFAAEIDKILHRPERPDWLTEVDRALAGLSWDATWKRMTGQLTKAMQARADEARTAPTPKPTLSQPKEGERYDYLIVGAGFAGAVLAERLAADGGKRVLVVDRRPHIGGNAYDELNEDGILIHRYGPHIFHTNSERIWDYLSRFTTWRPYEHRVLAYVDGKLLPIPINLDTINQLYGLDLTPEQMEDFLAQRAETPAEIKTSRDVVLAAVGRDLYAKFFEGYTRKQWGVDPSQLGKSVTARIPTRCNTDDRYFSDTYQAMPEHGYTRLLENMLKHPNIHLALGTDYREIEDKVRYGEMIYTGPIDEFFDYRFGRLPYRSLQFRHVTLDREQFQPRSVINYPTPDLPYTRITEYKQLTGQQHAKTAISFEFPCDDGDPYYPVPNPDNEARYKQYQALADATPGVHFVGRLATYRYYNMDQVVGQALALYQRLAEREQATAPALELWGGVECTVARIGNRYTDQLRASGHQYRISDLDLFVELGIKSLRYPVLWERICPERPDRCDWRWTDERLNRIRELGIRPILGLLHHGSGPRYTDLADPGFAQGFAEFAARVAERYPWATDYTPVNEPLTTARFSGLYGHWYPHGRDANTFLKLLGHELEATRLAMKAIRAVNPAARLIQTDDLGYTWTTPSLQYQADFENERRWLSWDLLTGRVGRDHPLRDYLLHHGVTEATLESWQASPCPPDVIGVNHYLSSERFLDERMEAYEEWRRGGNGRDRYADVEALRVVVDGCQGPKNLLRQTWERYHLPIAVTEAHNGCSREEQMRWFAEVWQAASELRAEGADIRAVTAWSLLGAKDWNSLLTRESDFYEPGPFDVRAAEPRPTAMAKLLKELASSGSSDHPVLDLPGWWHRHDRLQYAPVRCRPLQQPEIRSGFTGKHRALLIVGARGTLGQALARACVLRGLPHHLLGREALDIANPDRIRHVLADLKPWAVINAAGCVDVDLAEQDPQRCWRDNCEGPELLAAACAEQGIPLVTFSSDLVFDGNKPGAYGENDAVAPLNIYGKSKASAEQAVLGKHADALVIRSSGFFGPWDSANFAARTLGSLRAGQEVWAVDGVVVSPTYVPDLVDQTLDLLIDGEHGIWHLSNGGSISWYDFAREVASAWKLNPELVMPATPEDAGWIAPRPANSALHSERGQLMPRFESAFGRFVDALRRHGEPPPVLPLGLHAIHRPARVVCRRTDQARWAT